MGLSAPVEVAVDEAVKLVESLVNRILSGNGSEPRCIAKAGLTREVRGCETS